MQKIGLSFTGQLSYAEMLRNVQHAEEKGSTVDHILKVGDANLVVTTHRFCRNANITGDDVYVHIPPEAVTIIPN